MRDGAPGNDGVRMLAVKVASKPIKQQLHRMIVRLIDMKPEDWPEEIKEGWVIPLHKKGPKNDLGNYRGVCLLLDGRRNKKSVRDDRRVQRDPARGCPSRHHQGLPSHQQTPSVGYVSQIWHEGQGARPAERSP